MSHSLHRNRWRFRFPKTSSNLIMVHSKPTLPQGHGELLTEPDLDSWPSLLRANTMAASKWEMPVAGRSLADYRTLVRSQMLDVAREFSTRIGVQVEAGADDSRSVVMTGHQPELYHAGVWVKNFLLQEVAGRTDAIGINVVVDTDAFQSLTASMPCFCPEACRCTFELAEGEPEAYFAFAPVPSSAQIEAFCSAGADSLATLPTSSPARHFDAFCEELKIASRDATNIGELVTFARRRYESSADTTYLEVPLSALVRTEAFRLFVAHVVLDAPRFAACHNDELARYRKLTGTRSKTRPFPDLMTADEGWTELPFWHQTSAARTNMRCRLEGDTLLLDGGDASIEVPARPDAVAEALSEMTGIVSPKAVTLTMFLRLFASDLFIHGVGGAGYDRLTDAVICCYFGIDPPAFTVTSLTMYLPIGGHVAAEGEIAEVHQRIHRLEHNPDSMLGDVSFDDESERLRAIGLAEEKAELVEMISAPGADKKDLGSRIRVLNEELSAMLEPIREALTEELERLESMGADAEILTDRTYPFCLWSPAEIADKAG